MVADFGAVHGFDIREDILETAVDITLIVPDHGNPTGGQLPFVILIKLGDRNVKFKPHLVLEAFEDHPSFLQGLRTGDIKRNQENADMMCLLFNHLRR